MTRKGWLLFAAMSIFWGIPYLFIKIAVHDMDPALVALALVVIAGLALLPLAARRGALAPLRGRMLAVAGLALVQIAGPFLLISYGEQHITSSLTSLLVAAEPLLVALLALRLDPSESVTGMRLAGLFIGMVGVVALLGLDVGGDRFKLVGAVLVLLATAGYATGALLVKRPVFAGLPSLGVVAAECAFASLLLTPLALSHIPSHLPRGVALASLVVLGLVCTAAAWLTFFALVAEVGASRGTVFTYANPAIAVVLGIAVLGEPVHPATVAGFLLIIAGSWLSTGGTLGRRPVPPEAPLHVEQAL